MRFRLSIVALLLTVSGALAAPPKFVVPAETKPVDGWVRVVPETDAVSVVYVSLDGLSPFPSEELKDSRRLIIPVHSAKEGRYRFAAVASSKTGEQVRADFVVLVGTPKPDPQPNPQPNPNPQPVGDGKFFVVVIEETADLVAARGAFFADKALSDRFKEKGHKWRVADKDVVGPDGKPPADLVRFLNASQGKQLPQVFLADSKGVIVKQMDGKDKKPAELLSDLKNLGG